MALLRRHPPRCEAIRANRRWNGFDAQGAGGPRLREKRIIALARGISFGELSPILADGVSARRRNRGSSYGSRQEYADLDYSRRREDVVVMLRRVEESAQYRSHHPDGAR